LLERASPSAIQCGVQLVGGFLFARKEREMSEKDEEIYGYRTLIEHQARYKGYAYKVIFYEAGHRCGYVQLPAEHPAIQLCHEGNEDRPEWREYDYYALDIDVHGGLTYMAEGFPGIGVWVGFDCNHAWDLKDGEKASLVWPDRNPAFDEFMGFCYGGQSYRSTEYLVSECRGVITQLIEKFVGEIRLDENKIYRWFSTDKKVKK